MKQFLAIFSFAVATVVNAQVEAPMWADSSHQIFFNGNFGYQSTAFSVEMAEKFFYGGHIDSEMIDRASAKQKSLNQLLITGGSALSYRSPLFDSPIGTGAFWGVSLGTKMNSYNQYTDGLFNLTFKGNTDFLGSTVDIGNSYLQTFWYHELKLSLGLKGFVDHNAIQLEFQPKLILGVQQQDLDINEGQLSFSANGEQINFAGNGAFSLHDSTFSASEPKAIGVGLDISAKYQLGKFTFGGTLEDMLSWVNWQQQHAYEFDSTLSFSGLEVDDVFDISDSLLSAQDIIDSVTTDGNSNFSNWLPPTLSLYAQTKLNKSFSANAAFRFTGVEYYFIPLVLLQANYHYEGLKVGVSGTYGGFGGLQIGSHLSYQSEQFFARVGSLNTAGLFIKDKQYSQSLYLSVGLKIQ